MLSILCPCDTHCMLHVVLGGDEPVHCLISLPTL
jgi:hypothetical protein